MNYIKKPGILLVITIVVLSFSNCKKNAAPICRIITPKTESTFDYNEAINVEVSATDKDGRISYVELYVDDAGRYSLDAFPYNFKIVAANFALSPGAHTISALAKDDKGGQSFSAITVNINPKETTVPDFLTFADGRIPSAWYPTEWEVDNSMGKDDLSSIRAPRSNMAIATQKTGSASINSVEFWVKGSGQLDLYVDGTKAKTCDLSTEWRKHTVFFDEGLHTFKWEFNGQSVNMDAISFKYTQMPAVGDFWQGGIVVKLDGQHGIIAASTDQSDGIMWGADNTATRATDTATGTGNANTQKIVATLGGGLYAAKICSDLVLNGLDDWYLPSYDELHELFLLKETVGGFQSGRYWTSTVAFDNYGLERYARWINFGTGTHSLDSKQVVSRVRAIRSF